MIGWQWEEIISPDVPNVLYKGFAESAHADNFLAGNVRITTLSVCKALEGIRGDPGEGSRIYQITNAFEGTSEWSTIAKRVPIHGLEQARRAVISNCNVIPRFIDRYLLCTSWQLRGQFGAPVVRIKDAQAFFKRLSLAVVGRRYVRYAVMAKVIYRGREYIDAEPDSEPVAFVKPAEPFEDDCEVRLLWELEGSPEKLLGFEVCDPELTQWLERAR